jgi:hypothetical protein
VAVRSENSYRLILKIFKGVSGLGESGGLS